MSSQSHRLPIYALASPTEASRYAEKTKEGHYSLTAAERFWRDRSLYLEGYGYALRSRYDPEWSPSWLGTNLVPMFCEDSIKLVVRVLLRSLNASANAPVNLLSITMSSMLRVVKTIFELLSNAFQETQTSREWLSS